ncbi:hypothetical protein [Flavihumibacter sp. CACIAM 22H1]|uniref:hypothetical protein n=1 Tax=Flavihumibacter sp. CACIAM 22H1 TaxID=1812911 RepID=UPI0007A8335A|nr:hypothetical protein [Flavihumibacter sp. CACIAM 22H1]KYP13494.1 MAG: hypothetical protein A1D16_12770 [Flavihumibacter sp. CACIAM 22H1]
MPHNLKTYATILPRHQRLLFFVDGTISETALRRIMEANLLIWVGRYNPIVPVYNNTIGQEWLEMIRHFDPDIIYYSPTIDLRFLESLGLFHPREYTELKDEHRYYFPGVGSYCLLHEHGHNYFLTDHTKLLRYDEAYDMQVQAKLFYQLNFGFRPLYAEETKWIRGFSSTDINKDNANQINQLISTQRPYFTSLLSALHVHSIYLTRNESWKDKRFEWIICDTGHYLDDLLYYWNRQLYIEPRNILTQVVSTKDEIEALLTDEWFEPLLHHLSIDNQVCLVSRSMDETALAGIRSNMQQISRSARIEAEPLPAFPFKAGGVRQVRSSQVKAVKNLVLGKSDFLKLPPVTFENGRGIDNGPYAADIMLERDTGDEQQEIKFPYGTELHFIVCKEPSRVNKQHRATVFITRDNPGFDIAIPSDLDLIRAVLMYRRQHKNLVTLPISGLSPSSAGQKLSAFLKIFRNDWQLVRQFLEEALWLQLFRYESKLKDSGIAAGRGVFSYQDLEKELNGLYEKLMPEVAVNLKEKRDLDMDQAAVQQYLERCKKEAFAYHIDDNINFLIANGGLFVGMMVKCHQCGSNKWYSLSELRDKLPCKGCSGEIMPDLSSKVYYRLSDTIINNVLSDQTKNGKEYDGNYVVMKALLHLKGDLQETGNSFIWVPCLDFQGKSGNSPITSDADIVAIQNGKLVVGEGKYDSNDFSTKVMNSLVWMANELLVDKIVVACANGSLEEVVKYINDRLTNKRCRVIAYKASTPWYQLPGIFGMEPPKK